MNENGTPSRSRRAGSRGPVFVWANVVVLGWLALAVTLLTLHDALDVPVWVALHALLLGAVTNAIVIWSEHFVVTLCRVPGPSPRRLAFGLTALNLFVVVALVGVTADAAVLTGVGGTAVAVIAAVHTIHLLRMKKTALCARASTAHRVVRWARVSAGGLGCTVTATSRSSTPARGNCGSGMRLLTLASSVSCTEYLGSSGTAPLVGRTRWYLWASVPAAGPRSVLIRNLFPLPS